MLWERGFKMKNAFENAFDKLNKKDNSGAMQEVKETRYKTTKQISVYLDEGAIEFMKTKKLNRTQIINDAVVEYLKANYEYQS